jgi:hypothetical protein
MAALLATRRDVTVAVIDLDGHHTNGYAAWEVLHAGGRHIPALLVVNASALGRIDGEAEAHEDDEYLTGRTCRVRSAGGSRPCASAPSPWTTEAAGAPLDRDRRLEPPRPDARGVQLRAAWARPLWR